MSSQNLVAPAAAQKCRNGKILWWFSGSTRHRTAIVKCEQVVHIACHSDRRLQNPNRARQHKLNASSEKHTANQQLCNHAERLLFVGDALFEIAPTSIQGGCGLFVTAPESQASVSQGTIRSGGPQQNIPSNRARHFNIVKVSTIAASLPSKSNGTDFEPPFKLSKYQTLSKLALNGPL